MHSNVMCCQYAAKHDLQTKVCQTRCWWPRNTRYRAGAAPYSGRTSTGWIAPACGWRTHSITSSAREQIGDLNLRSLTELLSGRLDHLILQLFREALTLF
jgi:hypothetical protein